MSVGYQVKQNLKSRSWNQIYKYLRNCPKMGPATGITPVAFLSRVINMKTRKRFVRKRRILVFVTWRNKQTNEQKKNNCIHVESAHVHRPSTPPYPSCPCLHCAYFPWKYDATPILFCLHAVSVLLKIWWRYVTNFPDSCTWVHMV